MKVYGLNILVKGQLGVINHSYSHFNMDLVLFDCVKDGSITRPHKTYKWIKKSEIVDYPFHKANHKVFSLFKNDYWVI